MGENFGRDICLYCCALAVLITSSILIAVSYSIVEIDEIALVKHKRSQEVWYEEKFSESGRHFTGLFKELLVFKKTRILVDFADDSASPNSTETSDIVTSGGNSLACWTKDGSNVYIELSYHFILDKKYLLKFYKEYGDKWLDFVVRLSYSAIKETTVEYITEDFFTKRNEIQDKIMNNLKTSFASDFFGAVALQDLQLRKIDFDDSFENATVTKLIQLQKKKSFENQQRVRQIEAETEMEVQNRQNQINEILAEGTATAVKKAEELKSGAFKDLIISFNKVYKKMMDDLSITPTDIKKYIYAMEMELNGNIQYVKMVQNGIQKVTLT